MPSLDALTTIWIAAIICALFGIAGLIAAPSNGDHRFVARLALANGAMFLCLVYRARLGADTDAWSLAPMWTLWVAAALLIVSALQSATGQATADRVIAAGTFASFLALAATAALSRSMQPVAMMASVCVSSSCAYGFFTAWRVHRRHLSRVRLWVLSTFGIAFLATASHLPARFAEWQAGIAAPSHIGLTYLSMLVVWIAVNTGLIMTVNLDLMHSLSLTSQRDELTGILNRRGLHSRVDSRVRDDAIEGALVLIDIDHFKTVNDTHGHSTGDAVLRWFATELHRFKRAQDLLVRLGGEEFSLILPGCSEQDAIDVAERICRSLDKDARFVSDEMNMRVTASFGVALLDTAIAGINESLQRADEALYLAKRSGRNRVVAWSPAIAAPPQPFGVESSSHLPAI